MRRVALIAFAALLTTVNVAASGFSVGDAFKHVAAHHVRQCGTPTSGVTWTPLHAVQHFQRCEIQAWYSVNRALTSTPTPRPAPPTPTPTPYVFPTPVPTNTPIPSNDPTQYELGLMNADRAAYGLPAYTLNTTQSNGTASCVGSIGHSQAMAQSGQIWHTNPSYPAASFPNDICVPYYAGAGENVGMEGTTDAQAALSAIDQMMMSEPHSPGCTGNHACSIISSVYRQVGIGIVESGGATYLTVDFIG